MGRWRNMVTAKNEMTRALKVLKSAILIHVRVPAQPAFALHVSYILEYVLRHMNSECLQILFVDGKIKSIQKPHWSLSVVICQNEVSFDLLHTKSIHCAKFLCSLSDNVFPSIGWQVGSIEQSCAFSFGTSSLFRHKFVTCCSNGRVAFFFLQIWIWCSAQWMSMCHGCHGMSATIPLLRGEFGAHSLPCEYAILP